MRAACFRTRSSCNGLFFDTQVAIQKFAIKYGMHALQTVGVGGDNGLTVICQFEAVRFNRKRNHETILSHFHIHSRQFVAIGGRTRSRSIWRHKWLWRNYGWIRGWHRRLRRYGWHRRVWRNGQLRWHRWHGWHR